MTLTGLTAIHSLTGPGPDADPAGIATAAIANLAAYAAAHQLQLDPDSIRVDWVRWDAPTREWHVELYARPAGLVFVEYPPGATGSKTTTSPFDHPDPGGRISQAV